MGRHLFSSSQIIETDNDQGRNDSEQAHMLIARAGASEGNSSVYPVENMVIDGGNFASQWTPAPRPGGYSSTGLTVELPNYQPQAPGPSHGPFLHPPAAGGFHIVQENYPHHASSSNHGGQTFHGVDGGTFDFPPVPGRRPLKRKSPGLPPVCEVGGTSRYFDNGTSSGLGMPVDSWREKQVSESPQTPWDVHPSYRGHSLTICSEDTSRNVRHRAAFDLEANATRTHLSINPHNSITSLPADHSRSTDLWGQCPNALTREWDHSLVDPASQGRPFMSGNSGHSTRGVRSNYTQRSPPTFGASSGLHAGHGPPSDEGLPAVAESYAVRHSRPFSSVVLRDRSGRSRIHGDRYRSFPDEVVLRDHLASEGLMIAGRSSVYGSRSPFDQHRDMRLDIDNMSYEELLALEERIGNVSTGLADDLISKCLTELVFCSSDRSHEGRCVICLEEYENMDEVGTLKACSHDFHVECIRKWLSMKNLCPICKATALDDKMEKP